jgi:RNA polymerase sigma factor (TIGR02999 family)
MRQLSEILQAVENGERLAGDELLPLVYNELRNLAAAQLARERPGQTLQPTALVHEAYLRLIGGSKAPEWENRRHFFAAAAEAIRRILIERARRRATVKHGGGFRRMDLDASLVEDDDRASHLLALDEALMELERHDARAAQVVKLRYFAGLDLEETAAAMQFSGRTVDRMWAVAKAWLYQQLYGE